MKDVILRVKALVDEKVAEQKARKEQEEKDLEALKIAVQLESSESIVGAIKESSITKEDLTSAVSEVKIEVPEIKAPEVTVNVPEVKIPEINVPAPKVTVQPHVDIPKVDFSQTNKLLSKLIKQNEEEWHVELKLK